MFITTQNLQFKNIEVVITKILIPREYTSALPWWIRVVLPHPRQAPWTLPQAYQGSVVRYFLC